jgi:hypothetical protein
MFANQGKVEDKPGLSGNSRCTVKLALPLTWQMNSLCRITTDWSLLCIIGIAEEALLTIELVRIW